MGLEGNYQPLLPNGNGKQPSHLSPRYTPGLTSSENDQLDLHQLLAIARRRAIVIAGVAIAVTSGIVAQTLKQVPDYEGKFQLLVGSVSGDDQVEQLTESLSNGEKVQPGLDYDTQIQVLWSPQVLAPIVKQIQTRYPEINAEALRTQLTISRLEQTKILEIRYQDSDPEKIQFVLEQIAAGYVRYSQEAQQSSVKQGIEFVDTQTQKLGTRVDELQKELQEFQQQYNIIDPESQGEFLTNRVSAIAQQRQETQIQQREAQALYTKLQSQLKLSPSEALTAAALSEAPRYQEALNQFAAVERKIALESARFTEDSPTIQSLRAQQETLLPLLSQEAATVVGRSGSPVPDNAESLASPSSVRLGLIQKLVETTNQIQVLAVRNQSVAQAESLSNQQLKNLAVISRKYTDLQRQLNVATESLNRFLAVREALQIEDAQKTVPWQMIAEPQQPEDPISPSVPRGLLLGAIAGVLAGSAAGLLAEKLDRAFNSTDELKDGTGLPLLGTIPDVKELKSRTAAQTASAIANAVNPQFALGEGAGGYLTSPLLEAYRSLQANLQFLNPDHPIRSLVVSSAIPADGKSTVATFLALAAAAMGQRVLLVDADLRRSQLHLRLDLPNVWGLTNVISSDINVDDVIQRSPIEDNLFVLTAGQIPPDPTRILGSKKMQSLVERFQAAFDLVIFDTPPLLGLADAKLLAAHTDGIIMVVGLGRTDRSVLTQVLYGLRMSHAKILGVVANGVKGYTTGSYDYYHRYYAKAPKEQALSVSERR